VSLPGDAPTAIAIGTGRRPSALFYGKTSATLTAVDVTSLGLRTDLALLECAGSTVEDCGNHLVVRSPSNPTFYWGNFLLLDHVPDAELTDQWLARFEEALPAAGHRTFAFDRDDATIERLSGFAERGFRIERSSTMTAASVTSPPNPNAEATYRPLRSDEDWAQSVELRIACFEEYDETQHEFVMRRSASSRALVSRAGGDWFGAFVGERLVSQMGLVAAGSGLARFQSVETHPDFRGRGLAGSLVRHVALFGFRKLGAMTLVMVANPNDSAIRIYRALGFASVETTLQAERWPAWVA
jgi:ribosomal protein S18 acetylase RimI-like enzyme